MEAGIIAAIIALVGTIVATGVNYESQKATNEENKNINQQNLDYNAALTQAQWERDDNSHVREVQDLKNAGLSPLANTSGAQVTAGASAPTPISMQAPQIDVNSLINSVAEFGQLEETQRHNKATEKNRETELDIEYARVVNEVENLKIQDKKVEGELAHLIRLDKIEADRVAEIIRSNQKNEEIQMSKNEQEALSRESERLALERKKATGGKNIKTVDVYNIEDFKFYTTNRLEGWKTTIDKISKLKTNKYKADSVNDSANLGLGFGKNGVTNGLSSGGSNAYSENSSQEIQAIIDFFNENYPIPVYIVRSQYPYTYKKGSY